MHPHPVLVRSSLLGWDDGPTCRDSKKVYYERPTHGIHLAAWGQTEKTVQYVRTVKADAVYACIRYAVSNVSYQVIEYSSRVHVQYIQML